MPTDTPLSIPQRHSSPPRPLTDDERSGLMRIADVLIPNYQDLPAASAAPDVGRWLDRALAARSEKFDEIARVGGRFAGIPDADLDRAVRELAAQDPALFQPVSAVLAGAYLMVPAIRKAIAYPGQHASHPPFDLAAEEIMDGILDPVIERGSIYTPADA